MKSRVVGASVIVVILILGSVLRLSCTEGEGSELAADPRLANAAPEGPRRELDTPQGLSSHADNAPTETVAVASGCVMGRLSADYHGGPPAVGLRVRLTLSANSSREARSESDGRFLVDGLPALEAAELLAAGGGLASLPLRIPSLQEGERRDLGEIVVSVSHAVRGKVLDETGAPIADAEVEIHPWEIHGNLEDSTFPALLQAVHAEVTKGGLTHSDAAGNFAFDFIPVGDHALTATFPGRGTAIVAPFFVREGAPPWPVTIRLGPCRPVEGLVVDDGGRGIAGASVAAFSIDDQGYMSVDALRTRTAKDGSFRIEGAGPQMQAISVRAAGFVEAWGDSMPDRSAPVRIVLKKGGIIEGRVIDVTTGEPLGGASIQAMNLRDESLMEAQTSDAEGRYRFEGVDPEGRIAVLARLEGFMPARTGGLDRVDDEFRDAEIIEKAERGSAPCHRDLGLRPGVEIAGRVVQATSGAPIAGVRIEARVPGTVETLGPSSRPGPTHTAPDGSFRLRLQRAGLHFLSVSHAGFVLTGPPEERTKAGPDEDEGPAGDPPAGCLLVRVPEQGALEGLIVPLKPALSLAGIVVDAAGLPVEAAEVRWLRGLGLDTIQTAGDAALENPGVTTDADGRFRLTGLPTGEPILVQARRVDLPFGEVQVFDPGLLQGELRLVTSRGGRVEIFITNDDGTPGRGRELSLQEKGQLSWPFLVYADEGLRLHRGLRARTDEEGKAVFESVRPGTCLIRFLSGGEPPAAPVEDPGPIACRADQVTALSIKLERTSEITGQVVDAEGRPRPGILVTVESSGGGDPISSGSATYSVLTDAEGRFVIPGLRRKDSHRITARTSLGLFDPDDDPPGGPIREAASAPRTVRIGEVEDLKLVLLPIEGGR